MTALALDLLRQVSEAGGTIRLEGDMLRLSASEPLPDHLRARLRQHKAEIVALLSAAEPVQRAAPIPIADNQVARTFRPRWPTASAPSSQLTVRGVCRRTAGRRSSAIRISWSNVDGCTRRSTSAGPRPTCSAAISGRPGTGWTALASSC